MKKAENTILKTFRAWKVGIVFVVAVGIAGLSYFVYQKITSGTPLLSVFENKRIDITPEEIRAIKEIGQWEFLSINTEELVELHEKHFLGDKQLARIYTGTLRIGIDLSQANDDWFTVKGNKALLHLPDVRLLDDDFIDEAHSRSFYEKGTWDATARQRLYDMARQKMLQRCLTADNLAAARKNAQEQFTVLFRSFGFKEVEISFR